MLVTATTNGFIFQIIDSFMESIAIMYLLELKRGLSILLIFRQPGILPVWKRARESRSATHEIFLSVETALTLLYAQETTTAQL